jgi:glycerol kinase
MKKIRITWKDGTTEDQLVDEIIRNKRNKMLAVRTGDIMTAYPSSAITELPDDPVVASPSGAL